MKPINNYKHLVIGIIIHPDKSQEMDCYYPTNLAPFVGKLLIVGLTLDYNSRKVLLEFITQWRILERHKYFMHISLD